MATAELLEEVASHVGAAILALAHQEEAIAHEALALTDPRYWRDLEWIDHPARITGAGAWPRSIACSWTP